MKRTKRFTLRRIVLGLAVAAVVPATAQAKPVDVSGSDMRIIHAQAVADAQTRQSTVAIPYLSHGVGVTATDLGIAVSAGPDDRAFSRQSEASSSSNSIEIPYLSQGVGVTPADLGITLGPDDRQFSKATSLDPAPGATDNRGYDVGTGTVGGFAIALVLAAAAALAIRHSRRMKLSPA